MYENEYQFLEQQILISSEARELLGMSRQAFFQSVSMGKLEPFIRKGAEVGTGKVNLFLKEQVLTYKKQVIKNRK